MNPWRPASGHFKSHGDGTGHTLWRVCRDLPRELSRGSFEEFKRSDGKVWLHRDFQTASRKADALNAAEPIPYPEPHIPTPLW